MERALNAMSVEELKAVMAALGAPSYRAKQLFHFFHREKQYDIELAQQLPKPLREALRAYPIRSLSRVSELISRDGSRKYLLAVADSAVIETVFMPYSDRNTLCVSSQIGCLMGCRFCASTKAAFQRSLQAEEILGQVYFTEAHLGVNIDNIVLMGIGEPLDNYDEVIRFIRLVTDAQGKNMSVRSITLSTCGIVPKLYALASEGLPINLAISLHATSDQDRGVNMPVSKKYGINEILEACRHYFEVTGRRVSMEYVMIDGVNNRTRDIRWMADHLRDRAFHINLIPLNEIDEYDGRAVDHGAIYAFAEKLQRCGVTATVRNKRGADIDGACGQLRIRHQLGNEAKG